MVAAGLIGAMAATGSRPAGAGEGLALEEAFRRAYEAMLQGMEDGTCYRRKEPGRLKIALVGITPGNVHFNGALRENLNQAARASLKKYFSLSLDVLGPEAFRTIAGLAKLDPDRHDQFIAAIKKIERVPLVLVISAKRPARDIAQLKLEVFARRSEGMQVCPKTETLFVDLGPMRALARADLPYDSLGEDYVEEPRAFAYLLRRFAARLAKFRRLDLVVDLKVTGRCRLTRTAERKFRSAFSGLEAERSASLAVAPGEWPSLNVPRSAGADSTAPEADEAGGTTRGVLYLELTPAPEEPGTVELSLDLRQGARGLQSHYVRVLVPKRMLRGCRALEEDFLTSLVAEAAARSPTFRLLTEKPRYEVGDEITLVITPGARRYFYCWLIGSDETAYIVWPWSTSEAAKPWKSDRSVRYPDDFLLSTGRKSGLEGPMRYARSSKDLFGCFAAPERIPRRLEERWIGLHARNGGGTAPGGALAARTVRDLITEMRRVPGVEENYTWIDVTN